MSPFEGNRRGYGPEETGRHHGHHHGHHGQQDGEHRRHGHREDGGHGGHGGRGGVASLLDGRPNAMLLFVGAVGCARHRGFQMGDLMREGRMALLCPTAADYATGRYLHQIVEALVELSRERGVKEFVLMYGCQWAVLSTDFDLLEQELREEHGISATLHAKCHLCGTDHDDEEERK